MKLIVAGASGFVGRELIRQSLSNKSISSIVALTRHPLDITSFNDSSDTTKLRNAVVKDYGSYDDEEVQKGIAGADACIWTVAVTPSKQKGISFDEVRNVCQTHALAGLGALYAASRSATVGSDKPFRFIYMSGVAAERDQSKKPWFKPEYCLMRGEAETRVLSFAAERASKVECGIAKPGVILAPGWGFKRVAATGLWYYASIPSVEVGQCAAAMIKEVVEGFSKETLENSDLVRIGVEAVARGGAEGREGGKREEGD